MNMTVRRRNCCFDKPAQTSPQALHLVSRPFKCFPHRRHFHTGLSSTEIIWSSSRRHSSSYHSSFGLVLNSDWRSRWRLVSYAVTITLVVLHLAWNEEIEWYYAYEHCGKHHWKRLSEKHCGRRWPLHLKLWQVRPRFRLESIFWLKTSKHAQRTNKQKGQAEGSKQYFFWVEIPEKKFRTLEAMSPGSITFSFTSCLASKSDSVTTSQESFSSKSIDQSWSLVVEVSDWRVKARRSSTVTRKPNMGYKPAIPMIMQVSSISSDRYLSSSFSPM